MIRLMSALLLVCALVLPMAAEARTQASLNADWRFKREDVAGAEKVDFDDRQWQTATLPHTYNVGDGDDGGSYYRGAAWYRKTLELKVLPSNHRLYIQFDGAALVTELYVNGQRAGRHEGGYSAFRFDLTPYLKAGKNVLAVKVNNGAWPHVAPLGGDFTVFGGLYRNVWLIQTGDVGFDLLDHGGSGVAVTYEQVPFKHADLNIALSLRNSRRQSTRLTVQTRVFNAEGQQVLRLTKVVRLKAGESQISTLEGRLLKPRLWHGRQDPYLYSVVTEIADDNGVLDRTSTAFGIRTVAFDAQKGLLLNGQPYEAVGVNIHASRAGKGAAISDTDIVEDFNIMDDLGVTAVRLVHYPHSQTAYEDADRRGILILTEIPINASVADTALFRANAAQQMRELIRQNINHPSVIAWGLGNEVYATDGFVANILMELNNIAAEEDPTRPTIYAHCCQADNDPKAMQSNLIGFNRYFGWYSDEFSKMASWADEFHKAFPEKPFAVLEYGAGGSTLHQEDPPARVVPVSGWHPEQYQAAFHEGNWAALKARPFIWGKFVWQGFDAASDGRNEGDRAGVNDKGLVSYDRRTKKDAFYFYKAQWSKQPFVYITSRRHSERTVARTDVKIYSNQAQVTLMVNGQSVGTKPVVGGIALFPSVTLNAGLNDLTAESGAAKDRVKWKLNAPVPALVTPDRP